MAKTPLFTCDNQTKRRLSKPWKVFFLVSLLTLASGCAGREYVVKGENLQANMREDNFRTFYEIFVGGFSDSNEDGIGDLKGIQNRLDYLNDGDPNSGKSLGVNGLWLMPIMPSPSYHKYDVTNYKAVDGHYGTLDDFSALVAECQNRGIDVIIDLVLNHTSSQHPWFKQAKADLQAGNMDSPYIGYYSIVPSGNRESGKTYYSLYGDYYYEGNFSASMPELNMDNPAVLEEISSIIDFWLDLGVSGFRLDAAKYIYLGETQKNIDFWTWFMDTVRAKKADAFVVGEVWSGDSLIAPYYTNFSNFDFGMAGSEGEVAFCANGSEDVNSYVSYLNRYRNMVTAYNEEAVLAPFISNHDMNRAAGYLSVTDGRMQIAANLYLWTFGSPFIYYGEEIGMKGSRGSESTDANRRLAMLWGDKDTVENPAGSTYPDANQTNGTVASQKSSSTSLYTHYKKAIMIRNANPEIARGTYTVLNFDGYFTFGGFLSTYESSTVGVFHNTGEESLTIDLSLYTDHVFSTVRGYAGQGKASLNGTVLTLDGLTSVVLK